MVVAAIEGRSEARRWRLLIRDNIGIILANALRWLLMLLVNVGGTERWMRSREGKGIAVHSMRAMGGDG